MARRKQADLIKELTDRELTFHLILTQLILLFAAALLGFLLFPDGEAFFQHFHLSFAKCTYGLLNGAAVVAADTLLMKWLPKAYYDDGGVNERIFKSRSISDIIALTVLIAVAEELLFRGVIQTHFGLPAASLIFALMHIRYFGHWYLIANVLLLSFWIGAVYALSHENLPAVIIMHFTIDCLLGIRIKKQGI